MVIKIVTPRYPDKGNGVSFGWVGNIDMLKTSMSMEFDSEEDYLAYEAETKRINDLQEQRMAERMRAYYEMEAKEREARRIERERVLGTFTGKFRVRVDALINHAVGALHGVIDWLEKQKSNLV